MIHIVRQAISRSELQKIAEESFGEMVKAVVDVHREVIAFGGELHADEEALLLDDGSSQQNLWGINLYPSLSGDAMVEFDSMINIRPSQGNRSRAVENAETQRRIFEILNRLIKE